MEPNYQEQETGGKKTLWIVAGIIIVIMIIGIVYGATQKTLKNQSGDVMTGKNIPLNPDGTPMVAGDMVETSATVTSLDVVNLKTFPYKVQARVKADLADDCSVGNTTVTQADKVFTVTMTALKPKDAVCAQVVTPYETVIDLPVAGLVAGTYTVKLDGMTETFTLAQDNTVQFMGDK